MHTYITGKNTQSFRQYKLYNDGTIIHMVQRAVTNLEYKLGSRFITRNKGPGVKAKT